MTGPRSLNTILLVIGSVLSLSRFTECYIPASLAEIQYPSRSSIAVKNLISPIRKECNRSHLKLRSSEDRIELIEAPFSARRIAYLSLWTGLLAYTTDFSSKMSPEAIEAAPKILNSAVFTPFDGSLSPVFVTLFFFLGILPTVYGTLLLPSSKKQKVWALPFVSSAFALGFFGIGPYLGLRNKSPIPQALTPEDRDTGSDFFDNKVTPIFLLASTLYLIYFALNSTYEGGDRWQGYLDLFNTQPLARISTIDFTILSLAMWDPISEDMVRRNFKSPISAAAFCAIPVIGPVLYLCLRPSVAEDQD